MLKAIVLSVMIFCFCVGFVYPEKIGELDDILKPSWMRVDSNTVYVSDQYFIYCYSTDNLKLTNKIGGKGEGPGYFLIPPKFKILNDQILAYGAFQVSSFSKSGKIIRDKRFSKSFMSLDYVKGNFLIPLSTLAASPQEKFHVTNYTILDPNFKEIKVFHSKKYPVHRRGGKRKHYLVVPITSFQCYDGKIYLVDGKKGFFLKVFDSQGNLLNEIRKNYEKIKIPESYKERKYKEFINSPIIKKYWNAFKKLSEPAFPEYFPPIQDFRIANGKMYIKTYKSLNQKVEFLVLDINGKLLEKVYLPDVKSALFDIKDNRLNFLKEDEADEVWEFHRVKIQ